jgi:hypothetical protein
MTEQPLTVEPTGDLDRCSVCGKSPTYARGLCREDFLAKSKTAQATIKRGRGRPAKEPAKEEIIERITREQIQSMLVVTCQFLAVTLDESFAAATIDEKTGTLKVLPHVESATVQMEPWFAMYGQEFVKALPWFGLVGGLITIVQPGFEPLAQIIAGARKPRIFRKPRFDKQGKLIDADIYTERFKPIKSVSGKHPEGASHPEEPESEPTVSGKQGIA